MPFATVDSVSAYPREQLALICDDAVWTYDDVVEWTRRRAAETPAFEATRGSPRRHRAVRTPTDVLDLYSTVLRGHALHLVGESEPAPLALPPPSAVALPADLLSLVPSSGSTGSPRLIVHTAAAWRAHCRASHPTLGCTAADRWLHLLPYHHVGGLAIFMRCLDLGATVVLHRERRIDAAAVGAALWRHQITITSLVPTLLLRLLDAEITPPRSLRCVLVGGAASPPGLLERARLRGWPVRPSYGMTETASQIATADSADTDWLTPLPHCRLRSRDGHLEVATSSLFAGTVSAQGFEPAPLDGCWFRTRDVGHIDEHGRVAVLGRSDWMINRGGELIAPALVEAQLCARPEIAEAHVFGIDDEAWGQEICAAVVLTAPLLRGGFEALMEQIPPPNRARRAWCVPALPLGPTGKVDHSAVRRTCDGRTPDWIRAAARSTER